MLLNEYITTKEIVMSGTNVKDILSRLSEADIDIDKDGKVLIKNAEIAKELATSLKVPGKGGEAAWNLCLNISCEGIKDKLDAVKDASSSIK